MCWKATMSLAEPLLGARLLPPACLPTYQSALSSQS